MVDFFRVTLLLTIKISSRRQSYTAGEKLAVLQQAEIHENKASGHHLIVLSLGVHDALYYILYVIKIRV